MPLMPRAKAWVIGLGALLGGGCGGEGPVRPIDPPPLPSVDASSVAANAHNVVSVVVAATVSHADSVAVRYGIHGEPLDSLTPALVAPDWDVTLPVLGLLPDTPYQFQVVAFGADSTDEGKLLVLTTGVLPTDLPSYSASGTSPSPGFVLFAAGSYGIVIDNTGRVVWYRHLAGPTLNFQAQPTGRYTTSPVVIDSTDLEPWQEFDPLGNLTRTMGCGWGLRPRFHDLRVELDGSYWIMCDDTRVMDLTSTGGVTQAAVTGTAVQHLSLSEAILFEWDPFDHFAITDLDSISRSGAVVNWTHGNALDIDADGNLLVSFRSLSEVTKIDAQTGAVLWRMGGLANQFTFPGGAPPFARQHGLRVIGPGQLQVLDNLGEPTGSRAERYEFDEQGRTARLLASFSDAPAVTALLGGTTQVLPGGRILVAYGNGSRVQEYDEAGNVVWEIQGTPGYIFRAQRIQSLYQPGVGASR